MGIKQKLVGTDNCSSLPAGSGADYELELASDCYRRELTHLA